MAQHMGWCEAHNRTDPHYCGAACCARHQPSWHGEGVPCRNCIGWDESTLSIKRVETNDEDRCDSCNGQFSTTSDPLVECETDSQLADHDFEPQSIDPTFCEVDGWMKIEHELHRNLRVHESCFLDHDDILVRVTTRTYRAASRNPETWR